MPCHHSKTSLAALGLSLGLLLSGCSQPPAQQASSAAQASPSPAAAASLGQALTLEEAKAIALDHAQVSSDKADFQKLAEDTENGRKVFQLEFQSGSKLYEYEIDAATGQIVSSQWEALPEASGNGALTLEEAKAIALDHAQVSSDKADFQKLAEDTENGRKVFQLEFQSGSKLYEYEIDAATGQIVSSQWEALPEASGDGALTPEEAKALVLARAPGATEAGFREFQQDYEDGRLVYEGELAANGVEYEFEIDGATGEFLSWEEEAAHR